MNLTGTSDQERYLAERLGRFTRLPWDQNKIDELWATCVEIYITYGIQIDPRFLLAIIIQEGTGSFNTSSTNRGADGQHGIEVNFALDLMRAQHLIFGKLLGYIYYGNDFNSAVESNANFASSRGGMFDYANWQTPIVDLHNDIVRLGVYAGHSAWGIGVQSIYERLTYAGAGRNYSNYLANLDANLIQIIANDSGILLPQCNFVARQNGQDSLGNLDGTWTVVGELRR
jgi:hypothetical protein